MKSRSVVIGFMLMLFSFFSGCNESQLPISTTDKDYKQVFDGATKVKVVKQNNASNSDQKYVVYSFNSSKWETLGFIVQEKKWVGFSRKTYLYFKLASSDKTKAYGDTLIGLTDLPGLFSSAQGLVGSIASWLNITQLDSLLDKINSLSPSNSVIKVVDADDSSVGTFEGGVNDDSELKMEFKDKDGVVYGETTTFTAQSILNNQGVFLNNDGIGEYNLQRTIDENIPQIGSATITCDDRSSASIKLEEAIMMVVALDNIAGLLSDTDLAGYAGL